MLRNILIGALLPLAVGSVYAGGAECVAKAEGAASVAKAEKCTADTQACLNHMALKMKNRGWVGIELDQDEQTGILTVTFVEPDSPAMRGGFAAGDVLVALNGVKIGPENHETIAKAKEKMTIGQTVTYTVSRDGYKKDLAVELGRIPQDVLAKWVGRHMLDHATIEVAQKN